MVRIWDVETGLITRELTGHRAGVSFVEVFDNGRRLISGADFENVLVVWDPATGSVIHSTEGFHEYGGLFANENLYVTAEGQRVTAWDSQTGAQRASFDARGPVVDLSKADDGRVLVKTRRVAANGDDYVEREYLWDPVSDSSVRLRGAKSDEDEFIMFEREAGWAVESPNFLVEREVETGIELRRQWLPDTGQCHAMSHDRRHVPVSTFQAPDDRRVQLYELTTMTPVVDLEPVTEPISDVYFSPDDNEVLVLLGTDMSDYGARIYDASTGRAKGKRLDVGAGAILMDGGRVITYGPYSSLIDKQPQPKPTVLRDAYDGEVLWQMHEQSISGAAVDRDGTGVMGYFRGGPLMYWDTVSEQSEVLVEPVGWIPLLEYTRDHPHLLGGFYEQGESVLFDDLSGEMLGRFDVVAYQGDESPDGAHVALSLSSEIGGGDLAVYSSDGTSKYWSREVNGLLGFSERGRGLLTCEEITVVTERGERGELEQSFDAGLRRVRMYTSDVEAQRFAAGNSDGTVKLWDMKTREARELGQPVVAQTSVTVSASGKLAAIGPGGRTLNLHTGALGPSLTDEISEVEALTADDRYLVATVWDQPSARVEVYDLLTRERVWAENTGVGDSPHAVAVSPDTERLAMLVSYGVVEFELRTGEVLHTIDPERFDAYEPGFVTTLAYAPNSGELLLCGPTRCFSSDGESLTGTWFNTGGEWDEVKYMLTGAGVVGVAVDIDKDGMDEIELFDADPSGDTGVGRARCSIPVEYLDGRFAISADGERVIGITGFAGRLTSWSTSDCTQLGDAPAAEAGELAIHPNGDLVFAAAESHLEVYRTGGGEPVANVVGLEPGGWIVADGEGRFDAGDLRRLSMLTWRTPEEPDRPLVLDHFMREYYTPGLMAQIVDGVALAPLRSVPDLNRARPSVDIGRITTHDDGRVSVEVTVETSEWRYERDGQPQVDVSGARDLQLFRDEQLVAQVEGSLLASDERSRTFEVGPVSLPPGRDRVEFSAHAFNADKIRGPSAQRRHEYDKTDGGRRAYVLAIGVDDYQDPEFELDYAAADARWFADTLTSLLREGEAYEAVVPVVLAGSVSRAEVLAELDQLSSRGEASVGARAPMAGDLVILYFASHGVREDDGKFVFLMSDSSLDDLGSTGLSSARLSDQIRTIDAGDIILVVDACQSGALVQTGEFKAGPFGDRSFGQLAYDKRLAILAAARPNAEAFELERLGHGVLTYALLEDGLHDWDADTSPRDGTLTMSEWLAYGVERVPRLFGEVETGFNAKGISRVYGRLEQAPILFDFSEREAPLVLMRRP